MDTLPDIMTTNGYWLEDVGGGNYAIAYRIPNATVLCGTVNPDGSYTVSGGVDIYYLHDNGEPTDEVWATDTRLPEITTTDPLTAMTAMACAVAVTKVIA